MFALARCSHGHVTLSPCRCGDGSTTCKSHATSSCAEIAAVSDPSIRETSLGAHLVCVGATAPNPRVHTLVDMLLTLPTQTILDHIDGKIITDRLRTAWQSARNAIVESVNGLVDTVSVSDVLLAWLMKANDVPSSSVPSGEIIGSNASLFKLPLDDAAEGFMTIRLTGGATHVPIGTVDIEAHQSTHDAGEPGSKRQRLNPVNVVVYNGTVYMTTLPRSGAMIVVHGSVGAIVAFPSQAYSLFQTDGSVSGAIYLPTGMHTLSECTVHIDTSASIISRENMFNSVSTLQNVIVFGLGPNRLCLSRLGLMGQQSSKHLSSQASRLQSHVLHPVTTIGKADGCLGEIHYQPPDIDSRQPIKAVNLPMINPPERGSNVFVYNMADGDGIVCVFIDALTTRVQYVCTIGISRPVVIGVVYNDMVLSHCVTNNAGIAVQLYNRDQPVVYPAKMRVCVDYTSNHVVCPERTCMVHKALVLDDSRVLAVDTSHMTFSVADGWTYPCPDPVCGCKSVFTNTYECL